MAEGLLNQEIAIMKKMSHPNVLNLHEVVEDDLDSQLYLVTGLMPNGFLGSEAHKKYANLPDKDVPDFQVRSYFRQCVSGLFYCSLVFIKCIEL